MFTAFFFFVHKIHDTLYISLDMSCKNVSQILRKMYKLRAKFPLRPYELHGFYWDAFQEGHMFSTEMCSGLLCHLLPKLVKEHGEVRIEIYLRPVEKCNSHEAQTWSTALCKEILFESQENATRGLVADRR
jgi:hypothetical protein